MANLSKCDYVIETYTNKYKTLCQQIMYIYGDNKKRDFLRRKIDPSLTEFFSTQYFKKTKEGDKLIYEEKNRND